MNMGMEFKLPWEYVVAHEGSTGVIDQDIPGATREKLGDVSGEMKCWN